MSPFKTLLPLLAVAAALLSGCGMPASCEVSSDCPQATVCALGACRLECPCAEGEQCLEGACYASTCDSGVTCSAGTVCVGDTCGDPLCGGLDCGTKLCDPTTRQCVECLDDGQCAAATPTCQEGSCACVPSGSAELNCGDGRDDNCDGTIDCADETFCKDRPCAQNTGTCRGTTCCIPTEQAETLCSDGIDNDCDGLADCADLNCAGATCSDACENPSVCTAGVCPANGLRSAGAECRPASGLCDQAETCTGDSGHCPADGFAPATQVCRPGDPAKGCDATESCTGTGRDCPEDGVKAAATVCRPAQHEACDLAEQCDGTHDSCPPDQVFPESTPCTGAANGRLCDAPDGCDGRGACRDRFLPGGTSCRPSVDVRCDPAESCTGSAGECPADVHIASGSSCTPDGNDCTTEVCGADKRCTTGTVPDGGACLDGSGNTCCGGAPACFDLQTDRNHCGTCDGVCAESRNCVDGSCCEQCEDDPVGSLCCGAKRCAMKTIGGELKSLCE